MLAALESKLSYVMVIMVKFVMGTVKLRILDGGRAICVVVWRKTVYKSYGQYEARAELRWIRKELWWNVKSIGKHGSGAEHSPCC